MTRLDEEHPLGHALYARSAVCLMEAAEGANDKIVEAVETAVSKAGALKAQGVILPRLYWCAAAWPCGRWAMTARSTTPRPRRRRCRWTSRPRGSCSSRSTPS